MLPTAARLALIALVLLLPTRSFACEGPNNPFQNCGFENGLSGWEVDDLAGPTFPAAVVGPGVDPGFGFFASDPSQGSRAFVHGFDGDGPDALELSQLVLVPSEATRLVFSYRMAWDFWNWSPGERRTFGIRIEEFGGPDVEEFELVDLEPDTYDLDSGDREATISVAEWSGSLVRIVFRWDVPESYSGPSFFQLDDVRVLTEPECVDRLPPGEMIDDLLTSDCLADGGRTYLFNVASRTAPVNVSLEGDVPGLRWQLRAGGPDGPVVSEGNANVFSGNEDLTRGSWAVRVTSSGATGPFELFLGDSFQFCLGSISLGETQNSFFTGFCPLQLFEFDLATDTDVVLEMRSSRIDPYLAISDLTGAIVAFDDNSGPGDDARITASLPAGEYVLEASTPSGSPPTGTPDGDFTISAQAGGGGSDPGCPLALNDSNQGFGASGGFHTFGFTAGDGCAWQASVDRSWIRPVTATSGNGGGSFQYEVFPNPGSASRTATITVSTPERTRTHQVTQQGADPTACEPSDQRLCLNDGRFGVEVFWELPGESGQASVVELTGDTGYFWYFSESNVEMVLKVLDACGFADRFWVFAGGLTNVESRIEVTDSVTGIIRTYLNPQGTPFQPIQDTEAFATCDASRDGARREERRLTPRAHSPLAAPSIADSLPRAPCVPSETRLCLNGGRFAVDVEWQSGNGDQGVGQAEELTDDTGYFWFFDQSNVEMVIKVLDACGFSDRFWVFAGGLTNVEVDITVTDTETGEVSIYRNPQSTAFQPIQDTEAFATCP